MPLDINGQTKLVGLIGHPVEHSLSPAMHNSAFAALSLNWCYLPLPVLPERLGEAVAGLRALGFVGANVTVPHKEAVMSYLDEVTPEAQAIGAVNTIVVHEEQGELIGYNTDWQGFLTALSEGGFDPQGKRAVVLGAGGAARAVVYGLAQAGAQVSILNRTLTRAESLVQDFSPLFSSLSFLSLSPQTLKERAAEAHLLVNTMSVGMWPEVDQSPWPEDLGFPGHLTVFDLVYNPRQTKLLRQARRVGAKVIGGLEMLVHQGAAAFELWTGRKAPVETMYEAANKILVGAHK